MADTTRSLESTNSSGPLAFDDRTRRVLELRKQIREGTYRPDPEAVAKAMLREWLAVGEIERDEPAPEVGTVAQRHAVAGRFIIQKSAPEAPEAAVLTA